MSEYGPRVERDGMDGQKVAGRGTQETPVSPPYVRGRLPGGALIPFRRDPLSFLRKLALKHGDVVRFRMGPQDVFLLNDPEKIRDVLITHDRRFSKGPGLRVAERLLGKGLLTSEGEFHRRQRRLAQPAFHRPRLATYAALMTEYAVRWQEGWQDGAELDMAEEMRGLTLQITARTLFGADVDEEVSAISEALSEALRLFQWATLPFASRLEGLVPALPRRFNRARERLDTTVYRMIAEQRARGGEQDDLLTMLLLAQDTEDHGSRMTDLQLRDEAMTILLAGHETTANGLAWAWYLLAQHPDVQARLHAEVDEVLGGRPPGADDVARLAYTRMVLSEAMRCYPPAWIVVRRAVEECPLGDLVLPEGALVMMSPWVTHHDPKHYPDPFRFDPERWTPEAAAGRPRFAYYPFGGGSRVCIGEHFAWMESILVLAALASRWQFELAPGGRVVPQPLITLRPKYGIRMVARRRRG